MGGNDCIGEMIKYPKNFSSKKQDWFTSAKAGSCPRELFECDLQFAKDTLAEREVWNEEYHAFSTFGFDNRDEETALRAEVPQSSTSAVEGTIEFTTGSDSTKNNVVLMAKVESSKRLASNARHLVSNLASYPKCINSIKSLYLLTIGATKSITGSATTVELKSSYHNNDAYFSINSINDALLDLKLIESFICLHF